MGQKFGRGCGSGRFGGGAGKESHKLGGGGYGGLSGLIPSASRVQLSAVVLGLRRESHAPQCGRLVIAVEEVDIILEGVDKFPTKFQQTFQ